MHIRPFELVTVIVAVAVAIILVEGFNALWHWSEPRPPLAYSLMTAIGPEEEEGFYGPVITREATLQALLPLFEDEGLALGNSRFHQLRTDKARINTVVDACLVQKPNLDKEMVFLKAGLYEPFSPVSAFYDTDGNYSPEVLAFLETYGTRTIRHRTNEHGERLTLPAVEHPLKVIVAGDSIANGAMVDDSETLASRLQAKDTNRQYVNIGLGGADALEITCVLERAAERYGSEIKELIYIYCENDFKDDREMGTPEEVIAYLTKFAARNGIEKVTVIYAPYIYNIAPHLTRFRGYRGQRFDKHLRERRTLEQLADETGFAFLDMADQAFAEMEDSGSQLGALRLFVDHVHWSPVGTEKMASRVLALSKQ